MAGDPAAWWDMPLNRLAVFVSEIEALEASESLRMMNIMRVAQAGKDDGQARLLIQTWENKARRLGRIEEPEESKPSREEYFAMLGKMGLRRV